MNKINLTVILVLFPLFLFAQKSKDNHLNIVFYNVDKLFDTYDGPGKADDSFLPGSSKAWDKDRYEQKIKSLAENIAGASVSGQPDIIGLCGVENRNVIDDILNQKKLRKSDYTVNMIETDNQDVALVIKSELFDKEDVELITIDTTFGNKINEYPYNILYVRGRLKGTGILHFFVNEWPGTEGNIRAPEDLRMGAAIALRKKIDDILNFERDAKIIIMGTLYDEPTNKSIMSVLNATNKRKNLGYRDLYNLFYDSHNLNNKGTVLLNGIWQMWDQIIVSSSLLNTNSDIYTEHDSGMIYIPDDVNEDNSRLGSPYRGDTYTGYTSGHLPVYCNFMKREVK